MTASLRASLAPSRPATSSHYVFHKINHSQQCVTHNNNNNDQNIALQYFRDFRKNKKVEQIAKDGDSVVLYSHPDPLPYIIVC